MRLKKIENDFSVCILKDTSKINLDKKFCFVGKTDEEISLMCPTEDIPADTVKREDSWKAFRVEGILNFSLIGVLSGISSILAENRISIFAISTYNTDYIFIKSGDYERAIDVLDSYGYQII